jgi:hypothetical protein
MSRPKLIRMEDADNDIREPEMNRRKLQANIKRVGICRKGPLTKQEVRKPVSKQIIMNNTTLWNMSSLPTFRSNTVNIYSVFKNKY